MSEPRSDDAGLFRIMPIPGKTAHTSPLFAKPTAITVYSAPQPLHYRVVSYQIGWWLESPITQQEANDGWLFEDPSNNFEDTFFFMVDNRSWTIDELESGCLNHFLTTVVPQVQVANRYSLLTKIYRTQQEGRCWDIYVEELSTPMDTIISFKHIETYGLESDNKPLTLQSSQVHYRLLSDNEDVIIDMPFLPEEDSWENAASIVIAAPNTFKRRWAKRRPL